MAKSARSSTNKSNNAKLKSRVFGPVEAARTERLSAKLMELIAQPRPSQKNAEGAKMEVETDAVDTPTPIPTKQEIETDRMEVDHQATKDSAKQKYEKGRIEKRKSRSSKAAIVFPKYKNGKRVGTRKAKK